MAATLVEWLKTVRDPQRSGIIETILLEEPIMQRVPFRSIAGLAYPYNQEKTLPAVSFRNLNEAFTVSQGVVQRNVEVLKPFGGDSDTDKVLVDAYGNSERSSRDGMFSKAMAQKFVQTMLYGNSPASRAGTTFDDPKGFDGIQARVTTGQTLDAGGSSGSDGSSVFAVRFGDGFFQGLQTPVGLDSRDLGEIRSGGPLLRTRVDWTCGIGIFNGTSVAWIKDLTVTTNVLTTSLMDQLQDLITGAPSAYLMTKRSRRQLKTNALATGVALGITMDALGRPLDTWGGTPIYVSDAMIDTETVS